MLLFYYKARHSRKGQPVADRGGYVKEVVSHALVDIKLGRECFAPIFVYSAISSSAVGMVAMMSRISCQCVLMFLRVKGLEDVVLVLLEYAAGKVTEYGLHPCLVQRLIGLDLDSLALGVLVIGARA